MIFSAQRRLFAVLLTINTGLPTVAPAEISLSFGTGAYWHHQSALKATVDQFFGRPVISDDSSGGGGLGPSIRDTAENPYSATAHWVIALTLSKGFDVSENVQAITALRFEFGETRYALPNGFKPFIDPIDIEFRHFAITPSVALGRTFSGPGPFDLRVEAGAALDLLQGRTQLTSALLDVHRSETWRDAHLFGSVALSPDRLPQAALRLDLRWRRSIGPAVGLALQQRF